MGKKCTWLGMFCPLISKRTIRTYECVGPSRPDTLSTGMQGFPNSSKIDVKDEAQGGEENTYARMRTEKLPAVLNAWVNLREILPR